MPILFKVYCRRALLLSLVMLIAACATPTRHYEHSASAEQLLQQCCWKVRAKIGITQRGKKQSAMLNWHQQQDQFTIRLNGPFGLGAVKLSGDEQQVVLEQAGQAPISAPSAEALLSQAAGIEAPLDNLKFWIRGQPAVSSVEQLMFDDSGHRLQQFEQDGWLINLGRYRQFGQYELPGRIEIQPAKITPGREEQTMTLLISRWSFLKSTEPDS